MPAYVKVSGAWKQATTAPACYVKVNGAWKKCSQVYVKVNGAWKPCYATAKTVTKNIGKIVVKEGYGPDNAKVITLKNVKIGTDIILSATRGKWDLGHARAAITTENATYSSGGIFSEGKKEWQGGGYTWIVYYYFPPKTTTEVFFKATGTTVTFRIFLIAGGDISDFKVIYTEETY